MLRIRNLLAAAAVISLGACGGGGGSNFVPTPPPAPTPTPTPTPTTPPAGASAVSIFENPTPGEYAVEGVAIERDLTVEDEPLEPSFAADGQIGLRYDDSGYYEIALPGADWDYLVPHNADSQSETRNFRLSGRDDAGLTVYVGSAEGYDYSFLGYWYDWTGPTTIRSGYASVGIPTPASAIPVSGSATYTGSAFGVSSDTDFDPMGGGYYNNWVLGEITLNFDFGAGTLGGAISLRDYYDLVTINADFRDTVFGVGSQTFSGAFATNVPGLNAFSGRFTGPGAEETIGSFAIPYTYGGQTYQAAGAFVAKRP